MASTITVDFTNAPTPEPPRAIRLSAQQQHIMDWVENGTGNGLIIAVAGAGKTTTLIEALARMHGTVAFAAYNKRIADEIDQKVQQRNIATAAVKVGTFHAFGFRAWRRLHPRVQVDGRKIQNILKTNYGMMPQYLDEFVEKLVSLVRANAVGVTCPLDDDGAWTEIIAHHALDEQLFQDARRAGKSFDTDEEAEDVITEGVRFARRVLNDSIRMAETTIDFDDQLFMPLYANAPVDVYDWVLIDEAQDSNPTRRELARRMLRKGGRLLAVGDPAQAIYGFTGADSESLDNIARDFAAEELSLTVSYRCPRAVVKMAQLWVSHIEAADNAPEGFVGSTDEAELYQIIAGLEPTDLSKRAVLCRKNAPIVKFAFSLLRQRIPCHVEGRDIGGQVKNLARRWKTDSLIELHRFVTAYRDREVAKLMREKKEVQADTLSDRCDTLLVLAEACLSDDPDAIVADLFASIDVMFADGVNGGLTLSSIHKSKGREWPVVYWFGANAYQPSKFAKQEWQQLQERNLCYVAATRAMETLINVVVTEQK